MAALDRAGRTNPDGNPDLVLVTCDALAADPNAEDLELLAACRATGLNTELRSWSDRSVDWSAVGLAVLRSTWDYTQRAIEFRAWSLTVPRLCNPADVIAANTDKRYLGSIAAAGLPVVPTAFIAPGEEFSFAGTGEFVVKPSVGAGSRGAGRFDPTVAGDLDRAAAHARDLHAAGSTALVQPYLAEVDQRGETALIFFDGEFSHAIGKAAMLTAGDQYAVDGPALYVPERISARKPDPAELATGSAVLAHLTTGRDETLLYARIDLLPTADGPVLIEAELTEPSLFLGYAAGAADRFAAAIARRVPATGQP